MKNIFKRSVLLLSILIITSCSKEFLDINQDPNNAVESNMTAEVIVPQAMLVTASRISTGYSFLGHWLGYWAPGANYSPNGEEQSYNISTSFGAGQFSAIMDNIYDFHFAEQRAVSVNKNYYIGMAKVFKALNFTILVDLYNKVPYTEAMQGLSYIRPKYDEGQLVYENSINQLDSAIIYFKKAHDNGEIDADVIFRDIMFKGDDLLWKKFINTLKLRLLIHQSAKADRAAYILAEINKIKSEGSGFLASGEDAAVNPGFTQDKPNAYYATYGFNLAGNQATDFERANKFAIEQLKSTADPRIGAFYKKTTNTLPTGGSEPFPTGSPIEYRGNEYGRPIDNSTYPYQIANYVSQVGGASTAGPVTSTAVGIIKGYNQNAWIITSVESAFLQAEAIQRGWLTGDKESAYTDAIKESFRWLNIDASKAAADASFTKWYAAQVDAGNKNVSYANADDKLKIVLYQKYLAMNGTNHLEAWTDYRRNGYPAIPLSINPGRTSTSLPVRLLYPQREYDLNTANVQAAGTISQFNSKIWWMN